MKTYTLLIISFALAACSANTIGQGGETLGIDGSNFPSDLSPVVSSIRDRAFLNKVNTSWGAGFDSANAAGEALNNANNFPMINDIAVTDEGRTITVTASDMSSFVFRFDSSRSETEAYYTNRIGHPLVPGISTVRYVGIKLDPHGSLNALTWTGHNPDPGNADWAAVTTQAEFTAFRDKFWKKELVDFANKYAVIGDDSSFNSSFLKAVNKTWSPGVNAADSGNGNEGDVSTITVNSGGRSISLAFKSGKTYSFIFDSAKSAGEAFYRQSFRANGYAVTRIVGMKIDAASGLSWHTYDTNRAGAPPYNTALQAVTDQDSANTFNQDYQTRNRVDFTATGLYANIGRP